VWQGTLVAEHPKKIASSSSGLPASNREMTVGSINATGAAGTFGYPSNLGNRAGAASEP